MEQANKPIEASTKWESVILDEGEGEKILFRIGLMTFKVSPSQTNDNYMICETELPPGANVEPHSHPEAETFYVLDGEFTFTIKGIEGERKGKKGAFVSVPPYITHNFKNNGETKGKIFGTMVPGGSKGLESPFRNLGVQIADRSLVPDLDKPVENLIETINILKGS